MDMEKLNTVTEVARECFIYDHPAMPLKALAADLGKAYTTMIRELNPDDDGAKLGADLLVRMMQVSGDIRPLAWLAHKLGYMLIDKKSVHPDRPTWEGEHAQDTSDLGEMARLMDKGASPAKVHAQAMKACVNIAETAVRYERDKSLRQ